MAQGGGQGTLGLQRLTPVGNMKAELVSHGALQLSLEGSAARSHSPRAHLPASGTRALHRAGARRCHSSN